MTEDEMKYISKPPITYGDKIWSKAFTEYNKDNPNDKPLHLSCIPCYIKVFRYLRKKYEL